MTRGCLFFFFFYMYLSYIFHFKESTIITTTKKNKKQNKYKKKYRNVEGKSLPIVFDYVLPIRQTSPSFSLSLCFFFQLVLNFHPYLLVSFTIKGREPTRSFSYLFTSFFLFFFFPSFSEEQKSLLFVFKVDIQI